MPGYLPTLPEKANPQVLEAAKLAAGNQYPVQETDTSRHSGGSTDLGDLEHLQPVLLFNTGGMVDRLHSEKFDIVDEELAYIVTAKIFALSAYNLLKNGAVEAKKVIEEYHPIFTKKEYLAYMEKFINNEVFQPDKCEKNEVMKI